MLKTSPFYFNVAYQGQLQPHFAKMANNECCSLVCSSCKHHLVDIALIMRASTLVQAASETNETNRLLAYDILTGHCLRVALNFETAQEAATQVSNAMYAITIAPGSNSPFVGSIYNSSQPELGIPGEKPVRPLASILISPCHLLCCILTMEGHRQLRATCTLCLQ